MQKLSVFGLDGTAALIVGGGQGIGEATVLALAAAGCDVAILDSSPERAQNVAVKAQALGRETLVLSADILVEAQIEQAVVDAATKFPHLEKLVTIVGSAQFKPLLELDQQAWEQEHSINSKYVFQVSRLFAKSLMSRQRPGAITTISSVDGILAAPNHAAYGAAKAGVIHLVRSMAVEWAPFGIRVNSVAPGTVATPRLVDRPERARDGDRLPMKRRGTPEEIASAVLFFSSDMASYVTGQVLCVDGGLTATNILYL